MAYVCNSSSGTHNVNLQASLTGSSGSCSVSSSAATTSVPAPNGSTQAIGSGPNNIIGLGFGSNTHSATETINFAGSATRSVYFSDNTGGVGSTSSSSSGGSQASCSSSSATSSGGAVTSSSSQSQPGSCP